MVAVGCVVTASITHAQPASISPAQPYPTKPIRLLTAEVGGGSDFTARLLSHRLTESLGQQIVIDNRTGGVIIGDIASKAQPDGYTLMLYSSSLWLMPYMRSHVPYSMSHFAPVSYISASPLILVVHPSVAAKSVEELIALAKAKPGDLNYASGPMGASPHLAGELFKYMTGVNIVHIPFKGVGLAVNDVIAGRVQIATIKTNTYVLISDPQPAPGWRTYARSHPRVAALRLLRYRHATTKIREGPRSRCWCRA